MIPTSSLASPGVFPAAGGPVRGRRRPAERRTPAAACRSSSSGCSDGQSPGSSPPSPGPPSPGRSRWRPTWCWTPGCSTESPSPPRHRYCWSPTAAGSRETPPNHSTPLIQREGKKEVKKKPGASHLKDIDGGLTHFIKAGEASGHGCMFGGFAQVWSAG